MKISKLEKIIYVGCPWLFGMVMIVSGIFVSSSSPARPHGVVLICSGLISMGLFCIAALLAGILGTLRK